MATYTYGADAQPTAPAPVVVTADPPTPPKPSDPQNLDQSGAEEAVRSAVRALRTNDAKAFLHRLTDEDQRAAERGWRQVAALDGNPWISGMVNRVLRAGNTADGAQQVSNYLAPLLAMVDPQALGQQVSELNGAQNDPADRRRGGIARMVVQSGITAVVSSVLATGLESDQVKALRHWFDALALWLPSSGLNDPAKANQAAESFASAINKLGTSSLEELTRLDLPQVLDRVALAMPELKRVLLVYGLDLDHALDSVQLATHDLPPAAAVPGVNAKLVTVTFNAFGGTHELPLKLVEQGGRWRVSADSPVIAWLRSRQNEFDPRAMGGGFGRGQRGPGGPFGGGQGGPGGPGGAGGQRGPRGDAPAEPAPKPETNPGF